MYVEKCNIFILQEELIILIYYYFKLLLFLYYILNYILTNFFSIEISILN